MSPATRKLLRRTLKLLLLLYVFICLLLYFFQEHLIFLPGKLNKDYRFSFHQKFEELTIRSQEGKELNGLLFLADSAKGLIFYLHGNAGALDKWGSVARRYTDLHYDVFVMDYPGYGKSEGSIQSQEQLFQSVQMAYDEMKKKYSEEEIVVLGYSIGTGPAAKLASANHPGLLILQAPYYSLSDLMKHRFPVIPAFLLKYKLETAEYLRACKMPVVVFHGDEDDIIYYGSSLKLKASMKATDTFITLNGQGHNGITDNPQYVEAITEILNRK